MGILRSEGEDGRGRMKAAYKTCLSCGRPMKKAQYDASWIDEADGMSAMMDDDW